MMRVDQELLSIGHADLVENARHVMPNRAVTNRQLIGYVLVRESLSHQADNLAFSLSQCLWPRQRLWVGFDRLHEGYSEAQPPRRDMGARGSI